MWRVLYSMGIRESYKGFTFALYRDIIFNVTFFTLFGYLKEYLRDDKYRLSTSNLFVAFITAVSIGAFLSTPLDVLKSIYQHNQLPGRYTSTFDCAQYIYHGEGIYGLFKGSRIRVLELSGLYLLTVYYFELFREKFARDSVLSLTTWQQDLDYVKQGRLSKIASRMEDDIGFSLRSIKDMDKH